MYAVTDRFLQRARQSGKIKTVVDLYFDGELVSSDIAVIDGSISVDRGSNIHRSGSLIIGDPTLVPAIKSDVLTPYGTEIVIRSGVVYADGTEELVPLGVFTLEVTEWDEGPESIPNIQFFDRAKVLQRHTFYYPKSVAGKTIQDAITYLVGFANPGYIVHYDTSLANPKVPGGTTYDGSCLDAVQALAESVSAEIYFDVNGEIQVVPIPYIDESASTADTDWLVNVDPGDNTGVLIDAKRGLSRSETFSGVVVYGGTKFNNQQAIWFATNNNPSSPTYYNGPFGKAVKRIENSALTSDTACGNLAQAELRKVAGLAKSVSFTSLRNPALETGDIIQFDFFDGETELHILESFSIDFTSGEMSADTRAQVVNL